MNTSEWLSIIALVISSGSVALQARAWLMSGPRLHLSLIADARSYPDDGRGERLALTVINRGDEPTMLTHMVGYTFANCIQKWRERPQTAGIIPSANMPTKLDVNGTWMGMLFYDGEVTNNRATGRFYIGVIASHSNKSSLIRVPPRKTNAAPTERLGPDI
jgi:hypothetical protein